jgi:hypothetical protein
MNDIPLRGLAYANRHVEVCSYMYSNEHKCALYGCLKSAVVYQQYNPEASPYQAEIKSCTQADGTNGYVASGTHINHRWSGLKALGDFILREERGRMG